MQFKPCQEVFNYISSNTMRIAKKR